MPFGSGRKIDVAWTEVTKCENSSKVSCKHCGTAISGKIERIKAHLDKCLQNSKPANDVSPSDAVLHSSDDVSNTAEAKASGECSNNSTSCISNTKKEKGASINGCFFSKDNPC